MIGFTLRLNNIFFILYICKKARDEYDHHCYKVELENIRVENEIYSNKYSLIMVHGIGFRDYKYINYWGRITRYMISKLNMGEYVASLTIISTPNKGAELLDILSKLPDLVYRKVSTAIEFKENIKDDPRVY